MPDWFKRLRFRQWLGLGVAALALAGFLSSVPTLNFYRLDGAHPAAGPGEDAYAVLAEAAPATAPGAPEIKSPSAVLMDAASGQLLFAKNPHERRAPASVTKIMTLDLIMDALAQGRVGLNDPVSVSPLAAKQPGTTMFLEPGETVRLEDVLYGIAVASANDGSVAAAEHLGGSVKRFADMMNDAARQLGMKDTHWSNPSGLPDKAPHYTSAYDLALLARHLITRHPELFKYTATWEYWLEKGGKRFWLTNFNRGLVEYPGMDGLKTGFTEEAGFCLAATARRGDRRLVAVVLGSQTPQERNEDVYNLLDWGFASFDTVHLAKSTEKAGKAKVYEGRGRLVDAVPAEDVAITLSRGQGKDISRRVEISGPVIAPVKRGQVLGAIEILQGGRLVRKVPLVAVQDVPKAPLWQLFARYWRGLWQPRI